MDYKNELSIKISKALETIQEDVYAFIETPPDPAMGDFAFPVFRLAGKLKKAPNLIARELAEKIEKPYFISEIKIAGAYINFFMDKAVFAGEVIKEIKDKQLSYGKSDEGEGKKIVIDYSSPNIAKPFHVGLLKNTAIGNSIYNIYKFLGYESISINYWGDWGTQFGKLIVAYKKWSTKEEVEEKGLSELVRIYVKFHQEAETNESLNDEARSLLVKMQDGDEEALGIWKWINDISLVVFKRMYERLNVSFDYYRGESYYNDKMWPVVEDLKQKSLLVESDGAMIVDLSEYNMPPCLILRSDGGTLYPTRDISAAIDRMDTFGFHKCLYITDLRQELHFSQWIKVIELMGYSWADKLVHIPYGLLNLESGEMSARKGNFVEIEALLNDAVKKAEDIIKEKNPSLKNKSAVAEDVAVGAVKFNYLYNNRIKDVVFSLERILSFDGETGPYVQYTHARACSVMAKAGNSGYETAEADYSLLADSASFEVIKLLSSFPGKVSEAAEKYEPFIVTRHMVALAQAFNKFYDKCQILTDDISLREARLSLVYCVRTVLKQELSILGMAAPEEM